MDESNPSFFRVDIFLVLTTIAGTITIATGPALGKQGQNSISNQTALMSNHNPRLSVADISQGFRARKYGIQAKSC